MPPDATAILHRLEKPSALPTIQLVRGAELAAMLLYAAPTAAFRSFCTTLDIRPLPGRRDVYDLALVRRRLDEAQGLVPLASHPPITHVPDVSLVAQRRARLAQA